MKTILIVGPTATGKTDVAIKLAQALLDLRAVAGVDILSADSKQAYQQQDVVTGKDKEKFVGLNPRIKVHGIDVVKPDEEWSVAHFLRLAHFLTAQPESAEHILIVVGGTGQYISSLLNPPETAKVPRNDRLRSQLDFLTTTQLQDRLRQVDPKKLASLNSSDRQNPRRLVRAIEVASTPQIHAGELLVPKIEKPLILGLTLNESELESRIRRRVETRIKQGAIAETQRLTQDYLGWRSEAQAAIGYHEILSFIRGEIDQPELIDLWTRHELQYTRRQQLWLKKKLPVEWWKADERELAAHLEARVRAWYTE